MNESISRDFLVYLATEQIGDGVIV